MLQLQQRKSRHGNLTASGQRILKKGHIAGAPPKIAPSPVGIRAWFPGTTRVHTPNCIFIGSSFFVVLSVVINRQTHRPCHIIDNRLCPCMQRGLITIEPHCQHTTDKNTERRYVVKMYLRRHRRHCQDVQYDIDCIHSATQSLCYHTHCQAHK